MADNHESDSGHLPSVEFIDTSQTLWDVGSAQQERPKEFKNRMPKPTELADYRKGKSSGSNSNDGMQFGKNENIFGIDNPAFEREESSMEARTARYHGKYSTYEDMLKNMDDQDPFQGRPPSPREDLVRKSRENRQREASKGKIPLKTTSVSTRIPQPRDGGRSEPRPKRKKKKKPPTEDQSLSKSQDAKYDHDHYVDNPLNGTFTIMQDNPNYEPYMPPGRKLSQESTVTYTVGQDDSKRKLLSQQEVRPSSVEPEVKSSPGFHTHMPKVVTMSESTDHDNKDIYGDISQNDIPAFNREDTVFSVLGNLRNTTGLNYRIQEGIADYVTSYIKMRQCSKYIENTEPKYDIDRGSCRCGRDLPWHEELGLPRGSPEEKWSVHKHTETMPSTCYGTICFQGFGQEVSKNAPYVRIDQTTKPDIMWDLVNKHWKMPKPKLIISVTGGAKRFFLKSRLRNNFQRGLVNVATTTGAWIITGGTCAGVMEFVGEAVRDHMLAAGATDQKVVALGIATWGIVDNLDSLTPDTERGSFPTPYHANDLSSKSVRGKSPLDHNHTHFILVDNGQEKKFGAEIEFRAAFENYISEIETEVARNQSVTVPVVMLVLEGGENTIKTAAEALEKNTPVVIIQGSGRAADVIAFAYKYFKNRNTEDQLQFAPDEIRKTPKNARAYEEINHKVTEWLDWSRDKDNPKELEKKIFHLVKIIEKMLQKRNLLTVFYLDDIDTTNEIDQAILYALLKAKKSQFLQQLNLALAWNRCDIARQEIFKTENRHEWQSQIPALYDAMFTALVQNRIDFVQLFLDNGVELKDFLHVRRLRELYDEVVNDPRADRSAHLLQHMLQREQSNWRCCYRREQWKDDLPNLLEIVGQLINNLAGDHYQGIYKEAKYVVYDEHETPNKPHAKTEEFGLHTMGTSMEVNPMSTARSVTKRRSKHPKPPPDFDNPARDLLFWAVLLNRKELALLFWKMGKDHIGGALTASSIMKSLGEEAGREEEIDLSSELLETSTEFEELAVGVLNECYQRDKSVAHQLLTRSLDTWGNSTVLAISDTSEHMALMGHSSCQTKLNKIWKGRMALYTSMWKIIVGLVFFPFILPSIRFTKTNFDDLNIFGRPKKEVHNQVEPAVGHDDLRPGQQAKKKNTSQTLYKVDACNCCTNNDSINIFKAIIFFHTAPLVKFCYHTISYIIFLSLYSFFMLTNLKPTESGGPSNIEYIVWGWAATMLLEEVRQILTRDPNSFHHKFASYFTSVWNRFDISVFSLLILCIVLRYTLHGGDFVWARRAYALTLTLFFLRFMHTFYVEKNMGPKVIMIRKMLVDLISFILILSVFVLGYGVAAQALRFPNAPISWSILLNVVYMPYWQIYGELFLEDMKGDIEGCDGPTPGPGCPEKSWLVMLLLAVYMIFTNVLLLNLLIAMFSHTFSRVQENSEKVWRFFRYGLIYEYFDKPTLAPPLIILSHIFRLVKYIIRKWRKQHKVDSDFYKVLDKEDNNKLTAFERVGMENFLRHQHLLSREHIDTKVSTAGERIEKVIQDLEQIKESVVQPAADTVATPVESSVQLTTKPPSGSQVSSGASDQRDNIGGGVGGVQSRDNIGVLQSRVSGLQDQLEEQRVQMYKMFGMLETLTSRAVLPVPRQVQPAPDHPAPPNQALPVVPVEAPVQYKAPGQTQTAAEVPHPQVGWQTPGEKPPPHHVSMTRPGSEPHPEERRGDDRRDHHRHHRSQRGHSRDHRDQGKDHRDQGRDHRDQGKDHRDQGRDHRDQGRDHRDQGKDHRDQGRDHRDQGKDHRDQGRDHRDQGRDHKDQGRDHKDQGRDHRDQGRDHRDQGRDHRDQGRDHRDQDQSTRDDNQSGDHGRPVFDNRLARIPRVAEAPPQIEIQDFPPGYTNT